MRASVKFDCSNGATIDVALNDGRLTVRFVRPSRIILAREFSADVKAPVVVELLGADWKLFESERVALARSIDFVRTV